MISIQSWKDFQKEYDEPRYSERQLNEILEKQAEALRVSRVVQSFNGKYGPDCSIAMQILAIHRTPDGMLVIVR